MLQVGGHALSASTKLLLRRDCVLPFAGGGVEGVGGGGEGAGDCALYAGRSEWCVMSAGGHALHAVLCAGGRGG